MLLPIGDDQVKGGYYPLFSYSFIALNVLAFVYQLQSPGMLVAEYAAVPAEIMQGQHLWTLFTSMFMHGSFGHIFGNMLFMWVFADNIEATIGNFRFFIFYFLGGLAAHAAHIWFNLDSAVPTVGASGALSAVMGAYLVMFPSSRIKLWFFFLIFRVPAFLFLGIWIWMQWSSGWASLQVESSGGGTAWWAHIGGFVFGVAAGLYYRMAFSGEEVEQEVYP
ncbi:MAG: rhomboid family intramembrane serine protease [Bacteroidetes bacterium]|jgi:membrane associated rhomboid family serine protease|nr:rhomboid family intramembrane serine protease [Bacteroidota bacterium]